MALRLALLLLVCAPALALAQAPPDAGVAGVPTDASGDVDAAQQSFVGPKAQGPTDVAFPADAPPITAPVAVTVKLLVDETGAVATVTLVSAPQPVFDAAVIAAAQSFAFDPATFGGKPVKVEITFTHTFLPPAAPRRPSCRRRRGRSSPPRSRTGSSSSARAPRSRAPP